ncbi:MAG: MBL fold metallo-hydrolase [Lachnospiraceae bacterium]|nr:MBL fold metallo-hydrolase [Lachnospiraceae bacterium]
MKRYYYHEECRKGHYRINSPEGVFMDLVVGTRQAMLIDTGFGFGNLREYISSLTELPLVVVNTHGHPDHAGGNHQFTECPIYMSGKDRRLAESFFTEEERAKTVEGARHHSVDWSTGQTQDILPESFEPEKYVTAALPASKELSEGMVFDLGGLVLRTVAVPGHTCGSMALWNEETRELYVGDAIGKCLLLSWGSAGFAPYRDTVRKICSMGIETFYHGHDNIANVGKLLEPVEALVDTIGESVVYRRPCPMEPERWDYYLIRKGHTMEDMGKESFAMVVVNEEYFSEIEKEYGEFKVSA